MDNFAKAPKSIAEIRAEKEQDCALWTPRDMLIQMLRDIDSGKFAPDEMLVVYARHSEGTTLTGMLRANVKVLTAVGMIEAAKHDLLTATDS